MGKDAVETDVLIVGAGIAGCRAAIEAHDHGARVILATKGFFGKDCAATWMAVGGFQCWGIYPHDTLDVHVEDTLRAGWFLNNQDNVYAFLAFVPDAARELLKWGGRYRTKEGKFLPVWQLGCSTIEGRSIYPATRPRGNLGYQYSRIIPRQIRSRKISIFEHVFVTDLLTQDDSIVGAVGIDLGTGEFMVFRAKSTILATGGYEGHYKITDANPNLTGDGQAMALRAGIDMTDFEFNQTLPCVVWPPALEGDTLPFDLLLHWGAHFYNSQGERFLIRWDPVRMERSTRAIISRAIFHEIEAGRGSPHGGVYCSLAHMPQKFIHDKYHEKERTHAFLKLKAAGVDLHRDYIETGYAMHYCQGGCNINTKCETDKTGLYAIGEAASGSKDGADRLQSNALPYCMTTGMMAGREAAERAKAMKIPNTDDRQVKKMKERAFAPLERSQGVKVYQAKAPILELFSRELEYGRTKEGLEQVITEIERYKREILPNLCATNKSPRFNHEWINCLEFENVILVAECVARNALLRTESRGLHDRLDYADHDPNWLKNIHLRLVNGELQQWTTQVEFTYWEPEPGSLGEPLKRGVQKRPYTGARSKPLWEDA